MFVALGSREPVTPIRAIYGILLLMLRSAFIQGGLATLTDFAGVQTEMAHFGVPFPALSAAAAIVTELAGSALLALGILRCVAALSFAGFMLFTTGFANRFWGAAARPGPVRVRRRPVRASRAGGRLLLVALLNLRSRR